MGMISVGDFKQFAGIDYNTHDSILQIVLSGAEDFLARHMDAKFVRKEAIEYCEGGFKQLWLNNKPIVSVSEIYDMFTSTAIDPILYRYADASQDNQSCVVILDGFWEPGMRRYRVTYVGGWTFDTVPACVKLATMMLAARAWESRTGRSSTGAAGVSISYQELLQSDITDLIDPYSFARCIA